MNRGGEDYLRQLELLETLQSSIILDLEVQDVIPELLEKLVIVHSDKQRIEHEKTYEDRATVLLSIIKKKTENGNTEAMPIFVNSLHTKYPWLYSKLIFDENELDFKVPRRPKPQLTSAEHKQQKVRSILDAGGVQCLPRYTIDREDQVENVRGELKNLTRSQYFVITGMAGSGKSVLATQAVNCVPIVIDVFKDGIFWLPIGKECSESKDAIIAKMRQLCDKMGEIRAPNSIENGAELLRTAFLERTESLLILDDVWSAEVIKSFDVGCRTLVTTRDMSVIDVVADRMRCVKIPDGFTKKESLELFCQSLGTTLDQLPDEAESIHTECKGSPMVISLISALFHEHDVADKGRWFHYLTSLRKRKYSQMRKIRDYEHESVIDAISLSVESLAEKDRERYFDFALFQDDCGIPCQVLMVLWNLGKYEVEDIMKRFVRKTLAIEEYDSQRKCKIYSVHDLQLDYLKFQLFRSEVSEEMLHEKLINQYLQHYGNKFERLPDDGYIHFFLGYHLYRCRKYDYFARAYLNILFLGEKMKITGTADLLVDLRKYREYIIGDVSKEESDQRSKFIEEVTTLAQSIGHRIYNQPDIDIIQVALEMPDLPNIFKQAKEIAFRTPNRLYLEWSNASTNQWKNAEAVVLCTDNVRCVKFIGKVGNHFLAALSNGFIELCDLESCRIWHIYTGHSGFVSSIDVFQNLKTDKFIFVSASEDKSCKLWNMKPVLDNIESINNCQSTDSSPSPKIPSASFLCCDELNDESYLTFEFHSTPVLHAEFSFDGSLIISTSFNEILIWTSSNGQIISKISPDLSSIPVVSFQACHFSFVNNPDHFPFLLMSCENQVFIYAQETPSLFSTVEGHHMRIVSLLQLPFDAFCTVSENEIGLWKIMYGKTPSRSRSRSLSPRKSFPLTNFPDSGLPQVTKTQADALPMNYSSHGANGNKMMFKPGELLRPSSISNVSSRNSSFSSGGRDSPTLVSDCYSPVSVHTYIDNGTNYIKIFREDVLPKRRSGLYQCAAITEGGELLVCGTSDRRIVLWNLEKRQCLTEFSSHSGILRCLDFSKIDKWTLLSGSDDRTVMLWDLDEEQKGRKEPQKNLLYSSVFIETPFVQGTNYGYFVLLFTTDINTVQVYKDNKRIIETRQLDSPITACTLKNDGLIGVIGTRCGKLYKLKINHSSERVEQENQLFLIGACENEKILHLMFHENGIVLIVGTSKGNVLVFKDLLIQRTIKCDTEQMINFHFLFENEFVIAVIFRELGFLMIENVKTGQRLKGWKAEETIRANCSAVSANGRLLAVGTAKKGILLCEVQPDTGITRASFMFCTHSASIRSLAFSNNNERLAVGHDSGLLTIWKCSEYAEEFEEEMDLILHKGSIRSLKFSDDGKWLCSCGDKLAFWTLEKPLDKIAKPSFMAERRRKKSGDNSSRPNSRLSLEIGDGIKIGRKGKRELLQSFLFRGTYAQRFAVDPYFKKFVSVDESGIFYLIEVMASSFLPGASTL